MNIRFDQLFDARKLRACLVRALVPALVFYGVALAVLTSNGFDVLEVLRDPAQVASFHSLVGFLSNIGTWFWVSATAIGVFALLSTDLSADRRHKELLTLAVTLSFVLAVDDFFLIHDRYVNQRLCYAVYALCAGALLARHWRLIIAIEGFAFFLAGSLLASSILTDQLQPYLRHAYLELQIAEEGFKFTGAATWLYFMGRVAAYRPADTGRHGGEVRASARAPAGR